MRPAAGRTPPRRAGRPPRLSRDAIVGAALALLDASPAAPLTVARIAAALRVVPAALYRHFAGLDELLDAVLAEALRRGVPAIRSRAAWPAQLREWMASQRAQLLRYPAILPLLGRRGRTSPAWLDAAAGLVAILERAGLRGGELARAHLWIAETTVGIAMQEASLSLPEQVRSARASLARVSPEGRARLAAIVPHLAALDGDAFFDFVVERTLAALGAGAPLAPAQRRRRSRPRALPRGRRAAARPR